MKKGLHFIGWILLTALAAGICFVGNAFLGNPVSWFLADRAARSYIERTYSEQDIYIDRVAYSFKSTNYFAHILSHSSIDTEFYLYIDMFGNVTYDSYESWVLDKHTTQVRIQNAYRELTAPVIHAPEFPYTLEFGAGFLEICYDDTEEMEYGIGMPREQLILDKEYDLNDLGKEYGVLGFYMTDEEISVEKAAQIALEIKKRYDEAGVSFKILDMTLRYPHDAQYNRKEGSVYCILSYEDIYEEDLVQRIQHSHDERVEYYAHLDTENAKETVAISNISQ